MSVATLEELMEAGVHFGHQTRRWNPKMKPYIWGQRNGIYIIDLTQTAQKLDEAYNFVKTAASRGKKVVFVGTKKQAVDIIQEEAQRAGVFYINRRWLGGMLTNFDVIRTRINKLRELENMRDNGHFDRLPKKEVAVLNRQLAKLEKSLGGIKEMRGMPDIIFVVDPQRESLAIEEAKKTGITIITIADTNCDPEQANFVIPGNDDAIRAIRLLTSKMADAVIAGRAERNAVRADDRGANAADTEPSVVVASSAPEAVATDVVTEEVAAV